MKNKNMDINLKKLLIFPLTFFLFVSCSEEVSINIESGSESQICYIAPDLHVNLNLKSTIQITNYIEETINLRECQQNDILVIRSYKPKTKYQSYPGLFSDPIEHYCRFDREIHIERNMDDERIKLKCVLNSSNRRGIRYGVD